MWVAIGTESWLGGAPSCTPRDHKYSLQNSPHKLGKLHNDVCLVIIISCWACTCTYVILHSKFFKPRKQISQSVFGSTSGFAWSTDGLTVMIWAYSWCFTSTSINFSKNVHLVSSDLVVGRCRAHPDSWSSWCLAMSHIHLLELYSPAEQEEKKC